MSFNIFSFVNKSVSAKFNIMIFNTWRHLL